MREYSASLGNLSKIISTLGTIFLIGIFIYSGYLNYSEPRKEFAFMTAFGLFMILLPVITYFYMPRFYVVTDEALLIKRRAGNFRIPISSINKIELASKEDMRLTMRTFGNGGMFGFTGYFRNSKFGKMRWFVTQRTNYIVITTNDQKKYVVSPDEPEMMADDLARSII
jgi:hypothetical protein